MNMESFDWAGMAQKVGLALVILLVTWLVAKVIKWAIGNSWGESKVYNVKDMTGINWGNHSVRSRH